MLCPLFLTTSSFPPTVMNQKLGTMTNATSTEFSGDPNSAKRSSVHNSPASLASGSGSTTVTMSVNALLNRSMEKEEEEDEDDRIVKMLSLNTQASHANLRPIPLISSSYRSPSTDESSESTPSRPRNQSDAPETRKRGRQDEEEDEIQYIGRTPSTWKKWEASGGVRSENGSPYCYAYDDDGQRRSLISAVVEKLIYRL